MDEKDILASIVNEFNLKDVEEELEEEELEEEEEEILEDDEDEDEEDVEDEEIEEEVVTKLPKTEIGSEEYKLKPTKEEKERYAFEQLRKKAKEGEIKIKQLDEIAQMYGFTNHSEMVDKLQKDGLAKKAKEQGIDPKIYEDLQNTKKQLEQLRKERDDEVQTTKIKTFLGRVNEFATEYSLSEAEKSELIDNLDQDGFTVDSLYRVQNFKKLFSGYLNDKVIERERQKQIQKDTQKKRLREEPLEDAGGADGKVDLNKILDQMFKNSGSKY